MSLLYIGADVHGPGRFELMRHLQEEHAVAVPNPLVAQAFDSLLLLYDTARVHAAVGGPLLDAIIREAAHGYGVSGHLALDQEGNRRRGEYARVGVTLTDAGLRVTWLQLGVSDTRPARGVRFVGEETRNVSQVTTTQSPVSSFAVTLQVNPLLFQNCANGGAVVTLSEVIGSVRIVHIRLEQLREIGISLLPMVSGASVLLGCGSQEIVIDCPAVRLGEGASCNIVDIGKRQRGILPDSVRDVMTNCAATALDLASAAGHSAANYVPILGQIDDAINVYNTFVGPDAVNCIDTSLEQFGWQGGSVEDSLPPPVSIASVEDILVDSLSWFDDLTYDDNGGDYSGFSYDDYFSFDDDYFFDWLF